jgi:3-deoxy-D-manno-octulosonic-acid transferase
LKYDVVLPSVNRQGLYKELSLNCAEDKIISVGSLREGEEENIILVLKKLCCKYHSIKFILAPRHLHRIPHIASVLKKNNIEFVLRTEVKNKDAHCSMPFRCVLLDTYGELISVYSISEIAIIGGSFMKSYGGHNPVEAASYGIPVIFGPYMSNFLDIAEELKLKGGAIQVSSYEELYIALGKLVEDSEYRRKVGSNALSCILQHRGAAARTLSFIESLLNADANTT